jgi:hypothetical protein
MRWIAIGATVENVVVAAHDDITLLETVAEYDFDVIVKIYGLSDGEYNEIKAGNYDYRIRFNNLRSVYLERVERTDEVKQLSRIYVKRLQQMVAMRGRYEHALNKHRALLSQQYEIYEAKAMEAKDILGDPNSRFLLDGYVRDFAEEANMDTLAAATLIWAKYSNWHEYLRKIERLRLRHFKAVKKARTDEEFMALSAQVDKDFFINMLM